MRRETVESIVAKRDEALRLYGTAWLAIEVAADRIEDAHKAAMSAAPAARFTDSHHQEVREFFDAVKLPDMDKYTRVARKIIDTNVWSHLIEMTDLQKLMDKQAKDELRDQMRYVPDRVDPRTKQLITDDEAEKGLPPITVDNVYSTLKYFLATRDETFARGIANAFAKLDRRFRSHDGFKIGSRVILTRVFNEWGSFAYGSHHRDTLIDIERVFTILDGKDGNFTSAIGAIEGSRHGHRVQQSEAETEYFTIRGFKNGNAHLWFKRDDLLQKVNQVIAAYYGEVLGDSGVEEEDPLQSTKLIPAKRFGFYPTQEAGVKQVADLVPLYQERGAPSLRVLEPSAGTGNLARMCRAEQTRYDDGKQVTYRATVDCVEIQGHLADDLRATGEFGRVFCNDFLQLAPTVTGLYDRVVMNPPFDRERDIDHVLHAMKFLQPKGKLVAIMSAGTEWRDTKKSRAFRKLMNSKGAVFYDMPLGSFSVLGTNVSTIILAVWNDGSSHGWSGSARKFEQ